MQTSSKQKRLQHSGTLQLQRTHQLRRSSQKQRLICSCKQQVPAALNLTGVMDNHTRALQQPDKFADAEEVTRLPEHDAGIQ